MILISINQGRVRSTSHPGRAAATAAGRHLTNYAIFIGRPAPNTRIHQRFNNAPQHRPRRGMWTMACKSSPPALSTKLIYERGILHIASARSRHTAVSSASVPSILIKIHVCYFALSAGTRATTFKEYINYKNVRLWSNYCQRGCQE